MSRKISLSVVIAVIISILSLLLPGVHSRGAIKPFYGGEITIRLNEPVDFTFNPSSYSNLIFYSLIYENFFYLKKNGEIISNVFKEFTYDKQLYTLTLRLGDSVYLSNEKPVTAEHVRFSLKLFMEKDNAIARKLKRLIKQIQTISSENRVVLELMHDEPSIVNLLAVPELVLVTEKDDVFSGMFLPTEWSKNQYITLKPNPFYPGGRSYLDSVKVVFYDFYYPDVFLSHPGALKDKFIEMDSGTYQNLYLVFPQGKKSTSSPNARVALYSLLKEFFKSQSSKAKTSSSSNLNSFLDVVDLNALTSNEESPVAFNIKTFPMWKVLSILQSSRVQLYVMASLQNIEAPLNAYLKQTGIPIDTLYLRDDQLSNFLDNTSIKYLLVGKTFFGQMALEERIKKLLKEMSLDTYDAEYLKFLNQLDEISNVKDEGLTMELLSRITEKIAQDGIMLPLFQKRDSLYIKDRLEGIELDYYGRPLFRMVRVK